jgi:hypothetical protein
MPQTSIVIARLKFLFRRPQINVSVFSFISYYMKANIFSFVIDELHDRAPIGPPRIYEMICLVFRDLFYYRNLSDVCSRRR